MKTSGESRDQGQKGDDSEGWNSEARIADESPRQDPFDSTVARLLIPVDRSAWAVVAGYLGLVCVLLYPSPLAIVAGLLAIRDIRAKPGKHGLARAWFAIVMGILGTVGLILWELSDYR